MVSVSATVLWLSAYMQHLIINIFGWALFGIRTTFHCKSHCKVQVVAGTALYPTIILDKSGALYGGVLVFPQGKMTPQEKLQKRLQAQISKQGSCLYCVYTCVCVCVCACVCVRVFVCVLLI